MAEPLELQLHPSCYNCLAWSPDGQLAIAAGEYVHIMTPKIKKPDDEFFDTVIGRKASGPWSSVRLRVNVFTNREWDTILPSDRDDFSIGPEQSLSMAAVIAWSPSGLARYRRSVLAVLTTNLVLSFYEPRGPQHKWTRVGILTSTLLQYFVSLQADASKINLLRKTRVRAFTWCSPLKDPSSFDVESRWGRHLLTVTTDDNDVVFVQMKRLPESTDPAKLYSFEILSHIPMHEPVGRFPMINEGSLFAAAMDSRSRMTHVACGPWLESAVEGAPDHSYRAVAGVVYGSSLKLVVVNANVVPSGEGQSPPVRVSLLKLPDSLLDRLRIGNVNFTGPLLWMNTEMSGVMMIAGTFAGRATLVIPDSTYRGKQDSDMIFRQRRFPSAGIHDQPYEPTSAIIASTGVRTRPDTVYLSTLGSWAESSTMPTLELDNPPSEPEWMRQREERLARFDIQYDLGGLALARTWGLATYDGWVAAAFTMHPGDMPEYTTSTDAQTVVVFSTPGDTESSLFEPPSVPDEQLINRRARVLTFILTTAVEPQALDIDDSESAKIIYNAAACAITIYRDRPPLLDLARRALSRLSETFNVDLSSEISFCDSTGPENHENNRYVAIRPKPAEVLLSPGGQAVFETCEICGLDEVSSFVWSADRSMEAECAQGHVFLRCELTSLAIQRPNSSIFCGLCDRLYFHRELDGSGKEKEKDRETMDIDPPRSDAGRKSMYARLFEVFDTCPYCDGKYWYTS